MVDRYILFLISLTLTVEVVWCGYALTWDHCHCRWADWMAWSDCSRTCGGGERYRTREVWMRTDICTLDFNNCATDDMGYEYEKCNTICYNGGTYTTSGYCSCVTGWYGSCCSNGIFLFRLLKKIEYESNSKIYSAVQRFTLNSNRFT